LEESELLGQPPRRGAPGHRTELGGQVRLVVVAGLGREIRQPHAGSSRGRLSQAAPAKSNRNTRAAAFGDSPVSARNCEPK
jgi:hypothetical protein